MLNLYKLLCLSTLIAVLFLAGCGSILVPATEEQPEPKVLNPEIVNAIDLYCRNLVNVRRIALRFIRAVDPEWKSVCDRD